jgi:hypothetical protein
VPTRTVELVAGLSRTSATGEELTTDEGLTLTIDDGSEALTDEAGAESTVFARNKLTVNVEG